MHRARTQYQLFITLLFILCWGNANAEISGIIQNLKAKRDLALWNSYATCSDCKNDKTCTFLNGDCINDTGNSISSESYNQETEYKYWANAISDGIIKLFNIDNMSLDLYALSGASKDNHSLWEWKIYPYNNIDMYIELERDSNNYEDIYVYTIEDKENKEYTSKDFSSCSSNTIKMKFSPTSFVRIRAKILSDLSNYRMRVYHINDNTKITLIGIVLIICSSFCICFLLACFSCFVIWQYKSYMKMRTDRRLRRENYLKRLNSKGQRITDTMKHMKNDIFKNIDTKYNQDSWVICLEKFEEEWNVHVTNECLHVFHSKCLHEWYDNMPVLKDLCCPHWNTVNSVECKNKITLKVGDSDSDDLNAISDSDDMPTPPTAGLILPMVAIMPIEEDIESQNNRNQ